jgi:hypothetical protein
MKMSKKLNRGPITTVKPQPVVCSCEMEKLRNEIKDLRIKLEAQRNENECYKRLYDTAINTQINVTHKMYAMRAFKDGVEAELAAAKAESQLYRRASKMMGIINIIFTVGFAVMTAILIWR